MDQGLLDKMEMARDGWLAVCCVYACNIITTRKLKLNGNSNNNK